MPVRYSVTLADGSSPEDSPPSVEIDLDDPADRYRYVCPYGHTSWSRTNSHIHCYSCARHHDDVDPEHWHVLDKRTGDEIPWSAVRIIDRSKQRASD